MHILGVLTLLQLATFKFVFLYSDDNAVTNQVILLGLKHSETYAGILLITNRNIHRSLCNITLLGESFLQLNPENSLGDQNTNTTDSQIENIYFVRKGEGYEWKPALIEEISSRSIQFVGPIEKNEHATKNTVVSGMHDLSVIIVQKQGVIPLAYFTPFVSSQFDTKYVLHIPKMYPDLKQYVVVGDATVSSGGNVVDVYLPGKRLSLLQQKLNKKVLFETLKVRVMLKPNADHEFYTHSEHLLLKFDEFYKTEVLKTLSGDFTATIITSLSPIVVMVSVPNVRPSDSDNFDLDRDEMSDQLLPTVSWSKVYYIPKLLWDDYNGSTYKITTSVVFSAIAVEDGTYVQACDADAFELNALTSKEWKMVSSSNGCVVRANKPFSLIAHYTSFVDLGTSKYYIGAGLTSITGMSLWVSSYTFIVPNDNPWHFIILLVKSDMRRMILVNEEPLDLVWYRLSSNHDIYTSTYKVNSGTYRIRCRSSHSVFGAYFLHISNHSLAITPLYIRRILPSQPAESISAQIKDLYRCIDTVSYEASTFGRSDEIDNDCDGLVDEELCFAQFINKDDDGDGRIDEDCSGWADTSYLDDCIDHTDCNVYGQMFTCQQGACRCPDTLRSTDSHGWFYDQLDGLCWPAREHHSRGGLPFRHLNSECGMSFTKRDLFGVVSCLCINLLNPWENNMTCHKMLGDTYCAEYEYLCPDDHVCLSADLDFHCMTPTFCYGDMMSSCAEGYTCVLDKNLPVCRDETNECDTALGNVICPKTSECEDLIGGFTCMATSDPCLMYDRPCLPGFSCQIGESGSSYICVSNMGIPSDCDVNPCPDDRICIPISKGYLCQDYIPCRNVPYLVRNNCSLEEICLSVDKGYMCIPDQMALELKDKGWAIGAIVGVVMSILLIPILLLFLKNMRRVQSYRTDTDFMSTPKEKALEALNKFRQQVGDLEVSTFDRMKSALNRRSKKKKEARKSITDASEEILQSSTQDSEKKTRKKQAEKSGKRRAKQSREGTRTSPYKSADKASEKQKKRKAQQSNETPALPSPTTDQPVSVFQFEAPESPAMRVYLPRYSNFGKRKEPRLLKLQKDLAKSKEIPETKPINNKQNNPGNDHGELSNRYTKW